MHRTHDPQETQCREGAGRGPSNIFRQKALKQEDRRRHVIKSKRRKLVPKTAYVHTHTHTHTHTLSLSLEYCSAIRKEILPFVTTWMSFENAILTEITQTKAKTVINFIRNLKEQTS